LEIIGDALWIPNTYYDEIIVYDLKSETLVKRLKLDFKKKVEELDENEVDDEDMIRKNKFHCNQVFESFDGEKMALVHHTNGKQMLKVVAQKLLKAHGDGGVLNLKTGETKNLELKAPHSVRKVNGLYWVFDSGCNKLNMYDKTWTLVKNVRLKGWGRGGVFSDSSQIYFCGISKKRRRYLSLNGESAGENMIQGVSTDGETLFEIEVPDVDQLNNLYLIENNQVSLLKALRS
jgi:hypothetical protein